MSAVAGRVLLIPKGSYNSGTTYNMLDIVIYEGDSYVAKTTTQGHLPTDTDYWQRLTDVDGQLDPLTDAITDIKGEIITDNEAYILRQCKGNSVDLGLVGGSIAWNQLSKNDKATRTINNVEFKNNGDGTFTLNGQASATAIGEVTDSFTPVISGHKYLFTGCPSGGGDNYRLDLRDSSDYVYFTDSGNSAIYNCQNNISLRIIIRILSGYNPNGKVFRPMLIDLTQLFGSTIADYIYSLEQATAGAGVAWFRQYFPNAYYGYQSGKIESVDVGARIASKNLFNPDKFVQGLLNFSTGVLDNNNNWITSDYIPTFGKSKVTLSGYKRGVKVNYCVRFNEYDANYNKVASNDNINTSDVAFYYSAITLNANTKYVRASFGFNNEATTPSAFFATNDIQLEFGDTVTAYEDYDAHKVVFDSSKQLRGIPQLVNNKLSYDGDIYTADGTVTRKYGIVDLGTLTYQYISSNSYIKSTDLSNAKNGTNARCSKIFDPSSDISTATAPSFTIFGNQFYCAASGYTAPDAFKTAMSGVYLVYELATPTTESANPYQNPQRAFIDGTEEFIDAGVTASTRDVSIPVGNESEYNTSVVLPAAQDYVDGAVKKQTVYEQTLAASATSVSFSGVTLKANSIVTIGTSKIGLDYNSLTESSGTYTVTFDAQSSATTIYLIVTEV